jgi:hypothetical protein
MGLCSVAARDGQIGSPFFSGHERPETNTSPYITQSPSPGGPISWSVLFVLLCTEYAAAHEPFVQSLQDGTSRRASASKGLLAEGKIELPKVAQEKDA